MCRSGPFTGPLLTGRESNLAAAQSWHDGA
jgi:hypothetical protein